MKLVTAFIILTASLMFTQSYAVESGSAEKVSPKATKLAKECNLEARNSLISGDLALVEKLCTGAIEELEKSNADKKYLINPMLNMAFAFSLAGYLDKADPYYVKARDLGEEVYGKGSMELRKIENLLRNHEAMKLEMGIQKTSR